MSDVPQYRVPVCVSELPHASVCVSDLLERARFPKPNCLSVITSDVYVRVQHPDPHVYRYSIPIPKWLLSMYWY